MPAHPRSRRAKAARRARAQRRDPEEARRRREAGLARREAERRAALRRRRLRRLGAGAVVAAVVTAAGFGLWLLFRPGPELAGVERFAIADRSHVTGATYDTPTPVAGPHDPRAPACGTYRGGLDPALAVHALEHGVVVLWYDASRPELADALEEATASFDSHVIIAANDAVTADVVATAWNRRKTYDADDPEITEFVRTYRRRGPERVPCPR